MIPTCARPFGRQRAFRPVLIDGNEPFASMMPPMSLSDTPNASRSSDRARLDRVGVREGREQLVVLTSAERLAGRGGRVHRGSAPSSMRAPVPLARQSLERSSASPSEMSIIEVTPWLDEDPRLADPRDGPHVPPERVALVVRPGSLRRDPEPRGRPAERPRHDHPVAGPCAVPAHGPARHDLAGDASRRSTPRLRARGSRPPARARTRRSIRACRRRAPRPRRHRSRSESVSAQSANRGLAAIAAMSLTLTAIAL